MSSPFLAAHWLRRAALTPALVGMVDQGEQLLNTVRVHRVEPARLAAAASTLSSCWKDSASVWDGQRRATSARRSTASQGTLGPGTQEGQDPGRGRARHFRFACGSSWRFHPSWPCLWFGCQQRSWLTTRSESGCGQHQLHELGDVQGSAPVLGGASVVCVQEHRLSSPRHS